MDETRVDATDLDDGAEADVVAQLQAQYDRIMGTMRTLESLYALSDDSTHVCDLQSTTWMTPSSTTGSSLHLASLSPLTPIPASSEPPRSSDHVGSLSTAAAGLGISSEPSYSLRASLRDEMRIDIEIGQHRDADHRFLFLLQLLVNKPWFLQWQSLVPPVIRALGLNSSEPYAQLHDPPSSLDPFCTHVL